jgi:hypothetical protein
MDHICSVDTILLKNNDLRPLFVWKNQLKFLPLYDILLLYKGRPVLILVATTSYLRSRLNVLQGIFQSISFNSK